MSLEQKDEKEKARYEEKRKDKGEEDKETALVTSVLEEGGEIRAIVERSNKVSILACFIIILILDAHPST